MIKDSEIRHHQRILEDAERIWGRSGSSGRIRLERRANMLIEHCKLNPGMRVLEIGCGTGSLSERLVPTGVMLTATDILPEFLEITAQKCAGHRIETRIVDAETLTGLADGSFEAVVGLSILHHLDLKEVLASIHRVRSEE